MKAFFYPPPEDAHQQEGMHESPMPSLIAIVITAVATLGLFLWLRIPSTT